MQEYFCHKCEKAFVPQDESQCHMVADPKAKFTWLFECESCTTSVITPEVFKQQVEQTRAKIVSERLMTRYGCL